MSPSPTNRLRNVARKARGASASASAPADGPLTSGLFDPWYYGLQSGLEHDPQAALDHYVRTGAATGLLPNPLIDTDATGLAPDAVVRGVLDGSAREWPLRPFVDDVALVAMAPEAATHPGGPAGFYLQHARAGAPVPALGPRPWPRFVDQRRQQARALRRILDAGVFDRRYYELQTAREFPDDRAAIWHFLERGESEGLSPSPLYERSWYRSRAGVSMPMTFMHFLRTGQTAGAAGPHFDARTYLALHPGAAEHVGGPLGHFVQHTSAHGRTVPLPGSGITPTSWGAVSSAMSEMADVLGRQVSLQSPPPLRWARWYLESASPQVADGSGGAVREVAIISDAREWGETQPLGLESVLRQSHVRWRMHVVADAGRPLPAALAEALAADDRCAVVDTPHDGWADRVGDAVSAVHAGWTCFWHPGQQWHPEMLEGLLHHVGDDAGAHAAVVDVPLGADGKPGKSELLGPMARGESLLWQRPRSLAGVVMPTRWLQSRGGAFRPEAHDVLDWDHLLRHDHTLVFVPFVGVRGHDVGTLPTQPGLRSTYEHVVRAGRLIDWDAVRAQLGARVAGRVSLLIPTFRDRHLTRDAIDHALAGAGADRDVEVVVVDNGSAREVSAVLVSCFAGDSRVTIRRVPRNTNFATATNLAFAESTGDVVVLLNNDTRAEPGWLDHLVEPLTRPDVLGTQPLLLYADGTIQSAGTVFQGSWLVPAHLLASHPQEDLRPDVDLEFQAVTAACMAMRAELFADAGGLDPVFANGMEDIDLCLGLVERHGGRFVTVAESRVVHLESKSPGRFARVEPNRLRFLERWGGRMPGLQAQPWEQAGFVVTDVVPDAGLPASGRRTSGRLRLRRDAAIVEHGPGAGLPRLRWSVKISAPGGPRGDVWGDTYFANDLVRGLRRWGQDAFVVRRGAHERPGVDHLDDVALTLRGRMPAVVQPGATNVLWVISHPDAVSIDELHQGFDLAYSAGRAWAEQMSLTAPIKVRTLLQATDAARFTPDGDTMQDLGTLFVGRTREVLRPVVRDAVDVGADLTVFGDGWEQFIDPVHVAGQHLANELVPSAYRGARIVLNDHWDDMARLGFYSNRLFDAVAAGARVVSDHVDGFEDVFGASVRTYRTVDELRTLLDPTAVWPDAAALKANATRVGAAHSFDARAKVLLADVLDARGVTHDLHAR